MHEHVRLLQAWHAVWAQGHIEVIGNSKLAADIAGAMYNILCSLPDKDDTVTEFFGLSPGTLFQWKSHTCNYVL